MRTLVPILILLAGCSGTEPEATVDEASPSSDKGSGTTASSVEDLPPPPGGDAAKGALVYQAHCTACHSAKIVTQNRGSRQTWLARIRWMQDSQGLWPFDPATEGIILDYLETHYGPGEGARRPPIPRDLMPTNPYARSDVTAPPEAGPSH